VEEVHLRVGEGRRGADRSVRVTHDRTLRRQHVRAQPLPFWERALAAASLRWPMCRRHAAPCWRRSRLCWRSACYSLPLLFLTVGDVGSRRPACGGYLAPRTSRLPGRGQSADVASGSPSGTLNCSPTPAPCSTPLCTATDGARRCVS
jgi:hypothetical protein